MITGTLTHTHEDGTVLTLDQRLGDQWRPMFDAMKATDSAWRYSRNVGMYRQQSRDRIYTRTEADRLVAAVTASLTGEDVDITVDICNKPRGWTAAREAAAERGEERAERLEERAARHQAEADARYERGRQALDAIPFGQPILTDHYSARRDRRYRDKAVGQLDKSFELAREADQIAGRAAAVQTTVRREVGYLRRQIETRETQLRQIDGWVSEQAVLRRAQLEAEIADLRREIDESGQTVWSKDMFRPGDRLTSPDGTLRHIVRKANAKTVKLDTVWMRPDADGKRGRYGRPDTPETDLCPIVYPDFSNYSAGNEPYSGLHGSLRLWRHIDGEWVDITPTPSLQETSR